MIVDPAASLRCRGVRVEIGGRDYRIPVMTAAQWWPIITADDPIIAVMTLIPLGDLDDRLDSGEIGGAELADVARDVIEAAGGRSLHATLTLAALAHAAWPRVNGQMIMAGFRWDTAPLGAALDAIYWIAMEMIDEEHRKELQAELDKGDPAEERMSSKEAAAAFEAVAGPRPATGLRAPARATGEPSGGTRPRTRLSPKSRHHSGRSVSPTTPPGAPVGSAPAARSVLLQPGAPQASGTSPRPRRPVARSRRPRPGDGPESGSVPPG